MKQIVRVGAFEARESISFRGVPYLEVVKWKDNPLYHKFNDFEWLEDKQMFRSKNSSNYFVDANTLASKESCFTLLTMEYNQGDEPDYKSVGTRIVEYVSAEELNDFNACITGMYEYYNLVNKLAD